MKKIVTVFLAIIVVILITNCNTPTETMGQSNPVLEFGIRKTTYLKINVKNLIGDNIITLAKKEFQAGYHTVRWGGKNSKDDYVDEGFYHLSIYYANGKLWKRRLVYFKRN